MLRYAEYIWVRQRSFPGDHPAPSVFVVFCAIGQTNKVPAPQKGHRPLHGSHQDWWPPIVVMTIGSGSDTRCRRSSAGSRMADKMLRSLWRHLRNRNLCSHGHICSQSRNVQPDNVANRLQLRRNLHWNGQLRATITPHLSHAKPYKQKQPKP